MFSNKILKRIKDLEYDVDYWRSQTRKLRDDVVSLKLKTQASVRYCPKCNHPTMQVSDSFPSGEDWVQGFRCLTCGTKLVKKEKMEVYKGEDSRS